MESLSDHTSRYLTFAWPEAGIWPESAVVSGRLAAAASADTTAASRSGIGQIFRSGSRRIQARSVRCNRRPSIKTKANSPCREGREHWRGCNDAPVHGPTLNSAQSAAFDTTSPITTMCRDRSRKPAWPTPDRPGGAFITYPAAVVSRVWYSSGRTPAIDAHLGPNRRGTIPGGGECRWDTRCLRWRAEILPCSREASIWPSPVPAHRRTMPRAIE